MYDSIKLLHLAAAIVWLGGMAFMLLALRPAALQVLEPQVRARLMGAVWQRFFRIVWAAIALLVLSAGHLYGSALAMAARSAAAAASSSSSPPTNALSAMPLGWHLMLGIGAVMVLIFAYIYFVPYKKFKLALEQGLWPVAAQAAGLINRLVIVNFVLGWVAVAGVRVVH